MLSFDLIVIARLRVRAMSENSLSFCLIQRASERHVHWLSSLTYGVAHRFSLRGVEWSGRERESKNAHPHVVDIILGNASRCIHCAVIFETGALFVREIGWVVERHVIVVFVGDGIAKVRSA